MKTQEVQLKIDKPCHADWNSMTDIVGGKHCGHCAKKVLDVTLLEPEEIFQIIQSRGGGVCMRLNSEVLDKKIMLPKTKKEWIPAYLLQGFQQFSTKINSRYKKVALFIGAHFLLFHQLKAQAAKLVVSDKNNDSLDRKYLKSVSIEGKLMEQHKPFPIAYARVALLKNDFILASTFTDEDGIYRLEVKDSIQDNSPVKIKIIAMGHQDFQIEGLVINKPNIQIGPIELAPAIINLQGVEVSVVRHKPIIMGGIGTYSNHSRPFYPTFELVPLQNLDASPRPFRIDIEGGGTDLLR